MNLCCLWPSISVWKISKSCSELGLNWHNPMFRLMGLSSLLILATAVRGRYFSSLLQKIISFSFYFAQWNFVLTMQQGWWVKENYCIIFFNHSPRIINSLPKVGDLSISWNVFRLPILIGGFTIPDISISAWETSIFSSSVRVLSTFNQFHSRDSVKDISKPYKAFLHRIFTGWLSFLRK